MRITPMLSILCAAFLIAAPALADYEKGLQAYSQRDYRTAYQEFEPAANAGDARAQYSMGMLHYKGHGAQKDMDTAYMWFNMAAKGGHPKASTMVAKLDPMISDAAKQQTAAYEQSAVLESTMPSQDAEPLPGQSTPRASTGVPTNTQPITAPTDAVVEPIATGPQPGNVPQLDLPGVLLDPEPIPEQFKPENIQGIISKCTAGDQLQGKETDQGEIMLHNGTPFNGVALYTFEDGKVRTLSEYSNGLRDGVRLRYNQSDGVTSLESLREYREGLKNGIEMEYYPNGQQALQKHYVDGSMQDNLYRWYEDGSPRKWEVYDKGKCQYRVTFFDPKSGDGHPSSKPTVRAIMPLKGNQEHGLIQFFFKNGQVEIQEETVNGKCAGPRYVWDAKGALIEKTECVPEG